MSLYQDPILKLIFDAIDANDGGAIQSYHYGDPLFLPKSELPALIGQLDITTISDYTNAEDSHVFRYVLTLVTDIRDFFKDADNTATKNIHYGYQIAQKIMEERDASTYQLKSTAIADILKSNAFLANNVQIDTLNPMTISYGFTQGQRGENTWAWESDISFNVFFSQER